MTVSIDSLCGLCAKFRESKDSKFFFTQETELSNSAVFKMCNDKLVHESFVGCEEFEPTKSFYCARYECIVGTEICLNKQLRSLDESCEGCLQGRIVIEVMRGVQCSELK